VELDGLAVSALRSLIAEVKQRGSVIGWVTKNLLSRTPSCFGGTLSRRCQSHLQSLAPTNPHWARVVCYGPFPLCVVHKEGLCPSSGDINRLMMMMMKYGISRVLWYLLPFQEGLHWHRKLPSRSRQAPRLLQGRAAHARTRSAHRRPRQPRAHAHANAPPSAELTSEQLPNTHGDRSHAVSTQNIPGEYSV
jgi:hypothetical protein